MRVGLVCPYSLSLPGGVQGQVLGLGRALRSMGVEARVLGPCDGPPPDANVTPLGNSIPLAANGSMAAIAPDASATLRVLRALRDEDFDVVHLHEPLVPGPTLSALIFGAWPMVGTFHRSGQSPGYRITAPLAKVAVGRLTWRTAVSETAARTAAEVVGGSYEVVWNGIDTEAFDRARTRASAGSSWPAPPGCRTTIAFVGRHETRKGLAVLIDAMARLGSDVRLWVIGEGPDTARLQRLTDRDPRVEWLGTVTDEEKVARMCAADIFCAPSLSGESFGVVLLEGMAAGSVVVASDLPGYRNVARPGRDAVLVPPGDAAALAAALAGVAAGGPAVAEMLSSGFQRADHFSMTRLAAHYLQRYVAIASSLPSPSPTRRPRRRTAVRSR